MTDSATFREKGNEYFKLGNYEEALSYYTKALDSGPIKDTEKAVLFKNRAACYLKLNKFQEAAEDASQSLELSPNDPKALFRRCQAYDQLGRVEDAFKDAVLLIKVDPHNKAARPLFNKLNAVVQEKVKQQTSTSNKVNQMFNLAFDPDADHQKRLQALNNLIVLAREEAGASLIMIQGGLNKLKLLLTEKDSEIQQGAVRVLATLTKGSKSRCSSVIKEIGMNLLVQLLSLATNEDKASPLALLIQNVITYYTGLDEHLEKLKKYEDAKKKGEKMPFPHIKLGQLFTSCYEQQVKIGWFPGTRPSLVSRRFPYALPPQTISLCIATTDDFPMHCHHRRFPCALPPQTISLCIATTDDFPMHCHHRRFPYALPPQTISLCIATTDDFPMHCHHRRFPYALPPQTISLCIATTDDFPMHCHHRRFPCALPPCW
ncbi:Protein unc-45 B [Bulinus truncatus]|nr:Protein unc-45 B [Bulinus truncatus]